MPRAMGKFSPLAELRSAKCCSVEQPGILGPHHTLHFIALHSIVLTSAENSRDISLERGSSSRVLIVSFVHASPRGRPLFVSFTSRHPHGRPSPLDGDASRVLPLLLPDRLLLLRHAHDQHTVLHRRLDRAVLDVVRQLKVPLEPTERSVVNHVLGPCEQKHDVTLIAHT